MERWNRCTQLRFSADNTTAHWHHTPRGCGTPQGVLSLTATHLLLTIIAVTALHGCDVVKSVDWQRECPGEYLRINNIYEAAKKTVAAATNWQITSSLYINEAAGSNVTREHSVVAVYSEKENAIVVNLRGFREHVCGRSLSADDAYWQLYRTLVHECIHAYQQSVIEETVNITPQGVWLRFVREGHARVFTEVLMAGDNGEKLYPNSMAADNGEKLYPNSKPPYIRTMAARRKFLLGMLLHDVAKEYVAHRCHKIEQFKELLTEEVGYHKIISVPRPAEAEAVLEGVDATINGAMKGAGYSIDAPPVTVDYLSATAILAPSQFLSARSVMSYRGGVVCTGSRGNQYVDVIVLKFADGQNAREQFKRANEYHRLSGQTMERVSEWQCLWLGQRVLSFQVVGKVIFVVDANDRITASRIVNGIINVYEGNK